MGVVHDQESVAQHLVAVDQMMHVGPAVLKAADARAPAQKRALIVEVLPIPQVNSLGLQISTKDSFRREITAEL